MRKRVYVSTATPCPEFGMIIEDCLAYSLLIAAELLLFRYAYLQKSSR